MSSDGAVFSFFTTYSGLMRLKKVCSFFTCSPAQWQGQNKNDFKYMGSWGTCTVLWTMPVSCFNILRNLQGEGIYTMEGHELKIVTSFWFDVNAFYKDLEISETLGAQKFRMEKPRKIIRDTSGMSCWLWRSCIIRSWQTAGRAVAMDEILLNMIKGCHRTKKEWMHHLQFSP